MMTQFKQLQNIPLQLYLASILLLDLLTHATINPKSSSRWVNTTPNYKMFQSVCTWNNYPWIGHLKIRVDVSMAFNS